METNEVLRDDFVRSGMIPYFKLGHSRYYFVFIDRYYGTIIDGGGHVEKGEDFIDTAIRELTEESLNIFNCTYEDIIDNSMCIFDQNSIIIFYEVDITSKKEALSYCQEFRKYFNHCQRSYCREETKENSYLIYIEEEDLINVCDNKIIDLPREFLVMFKENITVPTKNSDLSFVEEFRNGLTVYPKVYPLISNLIKDFLDP